MTGQPHFVSTSLLLVHTFYWSIHEKEHGCHERICTGRQNENEGRVPRGAGGGTEIEQPYLILGASQNATGRGLVMGSGCNKTPRHHSTELAVWSSKAAAHSQTVLRETLLLPV